MNDDDDGEVVVVNDDDGGVDDDDGNNDHDINDDDGEVVVVNDDDDDDSNNNDDDDELPSLIDENHNSDDDDDDYHTSIDELEDIEWSALAVYKFSVGFTRTDPQKQIVTEKFVKDVFDLVESLCGIRRNAFCSHEVEVDRDEPTHVIFHFSVEQRRLKDGEATLESLKSKWIEYCNEHHADCPPPTTALHDDGGGSGLPLEYKSFLGKYPLHPCADEVTFVSDLSEGKRKGDASSSVCCGWCGIVTSLVLICVLLVLKMQGESFDFTGLETLPPDVDYYRVLKIPTSASMKEVRSSFRRLSLKYHPDKNPDCDNACLKRFHALSNAYSVLSNPVQRRVYDTLDTSYSEIKSMSVELDSTNFDRLVSSGADVLWIVQIYTDWHRSCRSVSSVWEDLVRKYDGPVKFGRVHLKYQESLVRRLPIVFGVVPTFIAFSRGRLSSTLTLPSLTNSLTQLTRFVEKQYPNVIDTVKRTGLQHFLEASDADESKSRAVLLSSRRRPSIGLMSIAYSVKPHVKFGHYHVSSPSDTNSVLRDLHVAIKSRKLPVLLWRENGVTMGQSVTSQTLPQAVRQIVHHLVPSLTPWSFHQLCCTSEKDACTLLVHCRSDAQEDVPSDVVDNFRRKAESAAQESPLRLFAVASATTGMEAFCAANNRSWSYVDVKDKCTLCMWDKDVHEEHDTWSSCPSREQPIEPRDDIFVLFGRQIEWATVYKLVTGFTAVLVSTRVYKLLPSLSREAKMIMFGTLMFGAVIVDGASGFLNRLGVDVS